METPTCWLYHCDQLIGDLHRAGFGLGLIHCVFDRPARGAFAHFDYCTGDSGGRGTLAQVRFLFHFDQEFAYHIAAEELVLQVPRIDNP